MEKCFQYRPASQSIIINDDLDTAKREILEVVTEFLNAEE